MRGKLQPLGLLAALLFSGLLLSLPAYRAAAQPPTSQPATGVPATQSPTIVPATPGAIYFPFEQSSEAALFLPSISSGSGRNTIDPLLGGGTPIYGLEGRLSRAPGENAAARLVTLDAQVYALTGANAEVDSMLVELAAQPVPANVKVWGVELADVSPTGMLQLMVTNVVSTDKTAPTALPALGPSGAPLAVIKYDRVNLRTGPGTRYAPSAQVTLDQQCELLGRSSANLWFLVRCDVSQLGWIDSRLVYVVGNVNAVPLADALYSGTPTPTPQPTPTRLPPRPPSTAWRASYYNNVDQSGAPALVQEASAVDFNWGSGSPHPDIRADNFSARFDRLVTFPQGAYRLFAQADDGVRVWLDNQVILDGWHGATRDSYSTNRLLAGEHTLRVDYYEASGLASVTFGWETVGSGTGWDAAYYDNSDLSGAPVVETQQAFGNLPLDRIWGASAPVAGVPADRWSARYTAVFRMPAGNYVFRANADDGVRIYLNGVLILNGWRDGYKEIQNRFIGVGAGAHTITVEYYERTGDARLQVWWYKESP